VRELGLKVDYDEDEIIQQLKEKGISGIAIHEDTIEILSFQGRIAFLDTNDLTTLNLIPGIIFSDLESIATGELLLMCRDDSLFQRMKEFFRVYLGEEKVRGFINEEDRYGLRIQGDKEELIKIGMGFSEADIKKIQNMGFNVILRPKNTLKITPEIVQHKLLTISEIENGSMIIFDEEEVIGFPSAEMLTITADFLQANSYPFGVIEFASQKGIHAIASTVSELAVRVHSITKEEMETIAADTAIDRWIRGAQERNVRLFYINPFLSRQEEDLVQINLHYIDSIRSELVDNGYMIGKASLFPTYQIPLYFIYILGLGIISAGILLLMEFFSIPSQYMLLLLTVGIIFLPLINLLIGKIFFMKILALASALIFPVLAVIKNKDNFLKPSLSKRKHSYSYIELLKRIIYGITGIMLISLVGGLLIGALLTHYQFMLAVQLFSGIKIAYIFPLMLITVYLWWIGKENKWLLIEDLKKPILFEHAFLVLLFLVFVVIYISRSGNFSFLPVPDIEEKMRLFLEKFLVARPRSKEFLIGYPLLSLAITMNALRIHFFKYPIIIMGAVAPVTVLNTFCHVHTSISFSLLRTFHGYWLGILLGILLASIFYLTNRIFRAWFDGKKYQ